VAGAAAELGVAPNTVSTLVGTLSAAGMVRRDPDPGDRRAARLNLTDTARRRLDRWRDEHVAVVAAAIRALDGADRRAVAAALPALNRLADRLRPEERS
jgi:DNA-binding MarR family transcriptional regulator